MKVKLILTLASSAFAIASCVPEPAPVIIIEDHRKIVKPAKKKKPVDTAESFRAITTRN